MNDKIPVAYATTAGSTGEVAEAVGKALRDGGALVDVRRAKEVAVARFVRRFTDLIECDQGLVKPDVVQEQNVDLEAQEKCGKIALLWPRQS